MKYTKEQRLNIGKQIYENKLTKYEASIQYDISIDCARDYMRLKNHHTIFMIVQKL